MLFMAVCVGTFGCVWGYLVCMYAMGQVNEDLREEANHWFNMYKKERDKRSN